MPDVSIIVVSYNSEPYLGRSLEAVVDSPYEVIVVDNASTDRSVLLVQERFPSVRVVARKTNVGFGAASNEGMSVAKGRYFLLLNPDAWPEPRAIEELVGFLDARPDVGVAGPQLRSTDGTLQRSSFGYPTALWVGTPAVTSSPSRSAAARRARPADVFLVGTALLLRRKALDAIGGFDPRFFMFNEEIDLCWRLREAGWGVELCPTATFVHVGGASTRTVWSAMYREQLRGHLLFLAKHRGIRHAEAARLVLLAVVRARSIVRRDPSADAFRDAAAWLASGNARRLLSDRE